MQESLYTFVFKVEFVYGRISRKSFVFQEMYYPDGQSPPAEIISLWLKLLADTFSEKKAKEEGHSIAIHCVAGLGR